MTERLKALFEKVWNQVLRKERAREDAVKYSGMLGKEIDKLLDESKEVTKETERRMEHAQGDEFLFLNKVWRSSTSASVLLTPLILLGDSLNRIGIYSKCRFWFLVVLAFVLGLVAGVAGTYHLVEKLVGLIRC